VISKVKGIFYEGCFTDLIVFFFFHESEDMDLAADLEEAS
jgi:hypothetical protein